MRNLCQSRSRIITLLNGENQALMLQSGHWTHGKFLQPTRPAKMTALGSICECRLLARNLLKLPGNFQDCGHPSLIAACGWFCERRVSPPASSTELRRLASGQTIIPLAPQTLHI